MSVFIDDTLENAPITLFILFYTVLYTPLFELSVLLLPT